MIRASSVFDAYGTLFDVAAAARRVGGGAGARGASPAAWPQVARDWRLKQLQYTWLRAITGAHADFWTVTARRRSTGRSRPPASATPGLRARLLALYRELDAYPGGAGDARRGCAAAGCATAILSNGSPAMLDAAVASAGIGGLLDAVLSVEAVGVFKPARAVYDLVGAAFGTRPGAGALRLVERLGRGGGAGYGFDTVWVNRAGEPRRPAALGAAAACCPISPAFPELARTA